MRTHSLRPVVAALGLAACVTAALTARQLSTPPGWKWVADADVEMGTTLDPAEGRWLFGTMAPGWHITTRPAVTLFEPSYSARGRFSIESETFLFPGASDEAFGIFAGGQDLEKKGRYVAFLIRRDGSGSIEAFEGGVRTALVPWTKSAAILPGAATGDPVRNVLRVDAEAATMTFLVNGAKVAEVSRAVARPDGIVGLRIGANLNLHVTNLDVVLRLALPRPVKPKAN